MRKDPLVNNELYHVYTRSIAEFRILENKKDTQRFIDTLHYYQNEKPEKSFSWYLRSAVHENNLDVLSKFKLVDIIAFCIMPTHVHFILKQLKNKGISIFMSNLLNSYTRYFNKKFNRKGPLWEGRFKSILIKSNEYLLHLTRYIHLNPVTANLVNKPEEWRESSYREYLGLADKEITNSKNILEINISDYRYFVEDRISYQKELGNIKHLLCD
ncbi:MAG: transposase [Elusimicrobia bacterium]|nr:transposase [Elusimicrobiota bacterium]